MCVENVSVCARVLASACQLARRLSMFDDLCCSSLSPPFPPSLPTNPSLPFRSVYR